MLQDRIAKCLEAGALFKLHEGALLNSGRATHQFQVPGQALVVVLFSSAEHIPWDLERNNHWLGIC